MSFWSAALREHSYGVSGDPTVDYNSQFGIAESFGVTGFPTVFNGIMLSGNYFQGYNTKAKWFNFFIVDDNMTKVMPGGTSFSSEPISGTIS